MADVADAFAELRIFLTETPDPRKRQGIRRELGDVLFMALIAIIAGVNSAETMEVFEETHKDSFRQRCGLRARVPSQDTFLRVLAALDPIAFGKVFQRWVDSIWRVEGQPGHISIDGKTPRGSFSNAAGTGPVHSVSAWLCNKGIVLGQVKVDSQSNEIIAIPALIKLLDIKGCTITIDAMGCQRAIAQQIVETGGDYILALKENQPSLCKEVTEFFADAEQTTRPLDDPAPIISVDEQTSKGHGRVETRRCTLARDLSWITNSQQWPGLTAIAKIERTRTTISTNKTSHDSAHFIGSSSTATATDVESIIQDHWGIENTLHWTLDITFQEDAARIRTKNAAQNFSIIRRAALNLRNAAPEPRTKKKISLSLRRFICSARYDYLETVLRLPPEAAQA
jgi:predicted transposase YbfD/YdcC